MGAAPTTPAWQEGAAAPAAWVLPGYSELVILLVVGLLIFGRDLPGVIRKFGRTLRDLRTQFDEFRNELNRDESFRDVSESMRELRDGVRSPADEMRRAYLDARDGPEPGAGTRPLEVRGIFEGLTDESLSTPAPALAETGPASSGGGEASGDGAGGETPSGSSPS